MELSAAAVGFSFPVESALAEELRGHWGPHPRQVEFLSARDVAGAWAAASDLGLSPRPSDCNLGKEKQSGRKRTNLLSNNERPKIIFQTLNLTDSLSTSKTHL